MTLKAGLVSTTYMNSGVAAATGISGTVGAFIPHHFDTTFKPACNNVFTYARQPVDATVIARNKSANTTVNYANVAGCSVCSKNVTLSNATETVPASGALSFTILAASRFANGVGSPDSTTPNIGNPLYYAMTTPQKAPLTVTLRAVDNSYPALPVTSAGFTEGASSVRSGRARMLNAYGSERLDLRVPFFIEYWAGTTGWQRSTDDACTGLNAPTHPVSYGAGLAILDRPNANYTCVWDKGTVGGESTSGCTPTAGVAERRYRDADSGHDLIPPGTVATFGADFNLWLRAPAAAGFGAGTVRVLAKVPSWLQFQWLGAAYSDPIARVTFGVIRSGPIIYRREAY
jgi:MSHA biogenesis protein MshQ